MSLKAVRTLAIAALLALMQQAIAGAEKTIKAIPDNLSGQPVVITQCTAVMADDKKTGDADAVFTPTTHLQNNSSQNVVALRLRFQLFNAFDDHLSDRNGIYDKMLGSGLDATPYWQFAGFAESPINYTRCIVLNVRFENGQTWTRPTSGV